MRQRISRRQVLAGGLAAALAGCGGDGRTTLTIMGSDGEVTPDVIKGFEKKHRDIKIKLLPVEPTRLTAMFASGDPPDVIRGAGAMESAYLAGRGIIEDLDPYFAKSKVLTTNGLAEVNDVWRYDGDKQGQGPLYGMTKDYSQDSMFWVNLDHFEKAKVEPPPEGEPIDFEEWLELAKRLTKRNGAQYDVYGLAPPFDVSLSSQLIAMTQSAGGSIFNESLDAVDFSAPEPRSVLDWYLRYAEAKVGPTAADPFPTGAATVFSARRLAMIGFGYWFSGLIIGTPDLPKVARLRPAPQFGVEQRVSPCHAAVGSWIPKKSKHKEEAWKFFEYFFAEKPALDRATSGWGLPAITSLESKLPREQPYQRDALRAQEAELEHFSVLNLSPYIKADALNVVVGQQLAKAVEHGDSAGKVADAINDATNPLIEQGKELIT